MSVVLSREDIHQFWFGEIDSAQWWKKDVAFDALIRERFAQIHMQARAGELAAWRETPRGALAEILILDQFSRNMWRDQPQSFAYDGMALILAQTAVAKGFDMQLPIVQRAFMYLPYMHSESLMMHDIAVQLYDQEGLEFNLKFEHAHRDIIVRFRRFPHRNAILGRESSVGELEFLAQPGSSF